MNKEIPYSVEKDGASVDTSVNELEKLIGMYFLMRLIQLPSVRAYWESATRFPAIADEMSRNWFQKLLSSLHSANNNEVTVDQKKIRLKTANMAESAEIKFSHSYP